MQLKRKEHIRVIMTIVLILRIALVGIIVSVVGHIIDSVGGKKEYNTIIQLCGLILVLYWVIPYLIDLFNSIKELLNFS